MWVCVEIGIGRLLRACVRASVCAWVLCVRVNSTDRGPWSQSHKSSCVQLSGARSVPVVAVHIQHTRHCSHRCSRVGRGCHITWVIASSDTTIGTKLVENSVACLSYYDAIQVKGIRLYVFVLPTPDCASGRKKQTGNISRNRRYPEDNYKVYIQQLLRQSKDYSL